MMNYNPNVERLNRQIEDLTNLRNSITQPQVQNIINTNPQIEFEAKILTENQNVSDIIVQNRTVFIDEFNKKVFIKETDGTISKQYGLIIPKTAEQLKIEELENNNRFLQNRLNELEVLINGKSASIISPNIEEQQSNAISDGNIKSSAKKPSK